LVGVIAFGGYVVADSFFVNQQAKEVLALEAKPAAAPVIKEDNAAATETPVAEDTSAQQLAQASQQVSGPSTNGGYSIAADQPKQLKIPKLGINAAVVSLGLTSGGAVDTPKNIWNAGWYNGSAKPGTDGAVFIDGHSSASRGALFGNLDKLVVGDQIQLERGDGSLITYRVAYTATVDRNAVDMASMMKPYGGAARGLNIITCVGKWIDSEKTLENRALVYAQQI
jgi:LPXTG-site transpeptidase (sortase) family protein